MQTARFWNHARMNDRNSSSNQIPPGIPGMPGEDHRPPRPVWETIVICVCGLSLVLFFFPDSVVHEKIKLAAGLAASVTLLVVFIRRIRAVRGMLADGEQPKLGAPKPYHAARKFDPKKH